MSTLTTGLDRLDSGLPGAPPRSSLMLPLANVKSGLVTVQITVKNMGGLSAVTFTPVTSTDAIQWYPHAQPTVASAPGVYSMGVVNCEGASYFGIGVTATGNSLGSSADFIFTYTPKGT